MQVEADSAINLYIFIHLAGLSLNTHTHTHAHTLFFLLKSPTLFFYFKFGKWNCQSKDSFPLVSGSSKGTIFKL